MPLSDKAAKFARWGLHAALAVLFVLELITPSDSPRIGAALVVLATVATLVSLARQLPLQNVLLAAVITAVVSGVAFGLTAQPGIAIPFGPLTFEAGAGEKIFNTVPWPLPLICIVIIFSARGVARHILRPWRKTKSYGWWVIGLTAVLVAAWDMAFEPFAVRTAHLWLWQPTKIPVTWQEASPMDPIAWFFMTVLILAIVTPWLIRKQPGSGHQQPDYQPVAVWLGALVLFAVGAVRNGGMGPLGIDAGLAAVTLIFVIRGIKW